MSAAFDLAQAERGLAVMICVAIIKWAPWLHLPQINVAVIDIETNIKCSGAARADAS
jgi:hypothetical protein